MQRALAGGGAVLLIGAMITGCGQAGSSRSVSAPSSGSSGVELPSPSVSSVQPSSNAVSGSASPTSAPTTRASNLPQSFPRYSLVAATVGRLLAQSSSVPVYLPKSYTYTHEIDVQYALKNGYRLTLSGGPALPANSPKIQYGYAEFLFSVQALPWSATYHETYVPLNPTPPSSQHGSIALAPGIVGTSYPSPPPTSDNQSVLITWQEDGWTFTVYGGGNVGAGTAKQMVKALHDATLPGTQGEAVFAVGTHVPSIASYAINGVRYVIEGNGEETMSLVEKMAKVQP